MPKATYHCNAPRCPGGGRWTALPRKRTSRQPPLRILQRRPRRHITRAPREYHCAPRNITLPKATFHCNAPRCPGGGRGMDPPRKCTSRQPPLRILQRRPSRHITRASREYHCATRNITSPKATYHCNACVASGRLRREKVNPSTTAPHRSSASQSRRRRVWNQGEALYGIRNSLRYGITPKACMESSRRDVFSSPPNHGRA